MENLLSPRQRELKSEAERLAREFLAPRSEEVDREWMWPRHSMQALAEAGLLGLHVPQRLGGRGEGLGALVVVTEALARACSSSAICFGMHCVGTAVIAAKATRLHEEKYLVPIAEGKHITTLALSESGTGAHFYLPQTGLRRRDDHFLVNGTKQFVTNGSQADSYVVSTLNGVSECQERGVICRSDCCAGNRRSRSSDRTVTDRS